MSNYQKITAILTEDGSHTLYNDKVGEHYHSQYGAIGESEHIFIRAGLECFANGTNNNSICIMETGFGTGLNALMSYKWCKEHNMLADYVSYEPYPLGEENIMQLNYPEELKVDKNLFLSMHNGRFNDEHKFFNLDVRKELFEESEPENNMYDVVFYDAFSPEVQPELWTVDVFSKVYNAMKKGGVFTTYSCKGIVKRALKEVGFSIEKLPGPPGKREFLRAVK